MYQNFEGIYGNLINQIQELAVEKEQIKVKVKRLVVLLIFLVIAVVAIVLLYKFEYIPGVKELQIVAMIGGAVFLVLFIIAVCKAANISNKYNKIFKTEILPEMILNIDDSLNYNPKKGLTESQYKASGLAINFNEFESEDYVSGYFADNALLEMSEIDAKEIVIDSEGRPYVANEFHGILTIANLRKSINNNIKIVKNSIWKTDRKSNIRIASIEFEKYFDLYADNKVQAMQIFTSDIIEEILYFAQEMKINIQIVINNNKFYITFETGEMYEGNITSNPKDLLSKYYVITNFMMNLVKKINQSIEEIVL